MSENPRCPGPLEAGAQGGCSQKLPLPWRAGVRKDTESVTCPACGTGTVGGSNLTPHRYPSYYQALLSHRKIILIDVGTTGDGESHGKMEKK